MRSFREFLKEEGGMAGGVTTGALPGGSAISNSTDNVEGLRTEPVYRHRKRKPCLVSRKGTRNPSKKCL